MQVSKYNVNICIKYNINICIRKKQVAFLGSSAYWRQHSRLQPIHPSI